MFSDVELQNSKLDLIDRIVLDHQSKGIAISPKAKYKISLIDEKFFMTSYVNQSEYIEEDVVNIKQIIEDQKLCYKGMFKHGRR